MIAVIALVYGAVVVTHNVQKFSRVAGLKTVLGDCLTGVK
jgi:predicted nucleic acid-binding protein